MGSMGVSIFDMCVCVCVCVDMGEVGQTDELTVEASEGVRCAWMKWE